MEDEQAWAKRLGVSIHTVFIGSGDYPEILDTLALSTNGARFQAIPEYETGVIRLHDREDGPPPTDAASQARQPAQDTSDSVESDAHSRSWAHSDAELSSATYGALHQDNFADNEKLSPEKMEEAMKLMELGRSPVSGNPVSGQGRFG